MADKKTQKGGKSKAGRNSVKCKAYAVKHNVFGKRRFTRSKERRLCGPLGYKQRADAAKFNRKPKSA